MELNSSVIKKSKSRYDVLLKVWGYANKRTYQKLDEYIIKNNININHWINEDKFCVNCGKKLNDRRKKFCDSSCAAKYNNKKRGCRSEITKNKISKALSGRKIKRNWSEKQKVKNIEKKYRTCLICEQIFEVKRISNNRLSKSKYCSDLCRNVKISNDVNERIKNGKHNGWNCRNIISYPEKFFITVLDNNNINYKHNYPVKQSNLGLDSQYNYFLDFFLPEKNIDLEIDGSQHKRRKKHDELRDKQLTENGYNVYRIKWKNINTENGKKYIKNEIDKFLNFYENLDDV